MKRSSHPIRKNKIEDDEIVFGFGLTPKAIFPEIKIRYTNSSKPNLGKLTSSEDVAHFIRRTFNQESIHFQESFIILYLNDKQEILGYFKRNTSNLKSTDVDLRLIYAIAIAIVSTSLVMIRYVRVIEPDKQDVSIILKMGEAGRKIDFGIIDHILINEDQHYSFAEENDFSALLRDIA